MQSPFLEQCVFLTVTGRSASAHPFQKSPGTYYNILPTSSFSDPGFSRTWKFRPRIGVVPRLLFPIAARKSNLPSKVCIYVAPRAGRALNRITGSMNRNRRRGRCDRNRAPVSPPRDRTGFTVTNRWAAGGARERNSAKVYKAATSLGFGYRHLPPSPPRRAKIPPRNFSTTRNCTED